MNKEEFIGKLQMVYVGDKNASTDIIKEYDRLNNIIDTMLEFSFFKEECPLNFGFGDEKEEESQDIFYSDEYCENNCNNEYKKCWLKYFERLKELKDSD